MKRIEKLETLIRIDEVIKSYEKQIDLINDTIKHRKTLTICLLSYVLKMR